MLFVLEPLSLVGGAVRVLVNSLAVSFIIEPTAFVYVAISVHQSAVTIGLVTLPLSVVTGAVGPHLGALSLLLARNALSGVHRAVWESNRSCSLDFTVRSFGCLFLLLVFALDAVFLRLRLRPIIISG